MGLLEEIKAQLDRIEAKLGAPAADKPAAAAPKGKAAAKKEEPKTEEIEALEDDSDPFAAVEEETLTAEEVGAKCKTILDAKTDKKGFRAGFIKILKEQFGADNVGKVPVEKLAELMASVEKLGASIK